MLNPWKKQFSSSPATTMFFAGWTFANLSITREENCDVGIKSMKKLTKTNLRQWKKCFALNLIKELEKAISVKASRESEGEFFNWVTRVFAENHKSLRLINYRSLLDGVGIAPTKFFSEKVIWRMCNVLKFLMLFPRRKKKLRETFLSLVLKLIAHKTHSLWIEVPCASTFTSYSLRRRNKLQSSTEQVQTFLKSF